MQLREPPRSIEQHSPSGPPKFCDGMELVLRWLRLELNQKAGVFHVPADAQSPAIVAV
jgi:hypothetical protein